MDGLILPEGCELTTSKSRFQEATVVVFHIPDLIGIEALSKQQGQVWVAWSMECEAHYPRMLNPEFMRLFDLTMTYKRDSNVYCSYFRSVNLSDLAAPPAPKVKDKLAVAFLSSRYDKSGRMEYLGELMQHLDVHSYGHQLRNRQLIHDDGRTTKLAIIRYYKFSIAFENAIAQDYVTEKFLDPLLVGSVPLYLGAPNVDEFAPGDHSYINVGDFHSPRKLAEFLQALNEDDAAYEEFLAWKQKPFRSSFIRMLEEQQVHPFQRLCREVFQLRATRPWEFE